MNVRSLFFVGLVCMSVLRPHPGMAATNDSQLPPSWPWRGVNLNSVSSDADTLNEVSMLSGINTVTLVLKPITYSQRKRVDEETAWRSTVLWADQMLRVCKEKGLLAIISLNEFPIVAGGNTRAAEYWNNAKNSDAIFSYTKRVVSHFSNQHPEVVAFEFFNEPVEMVGSGKFSVPKEWPVIQGEILEIIRDSSDKWVIVNPGLGGESNGYRDFHPIDDPRLVYAFHMYIPHRFTHQGLGARKKGIVYPGKIDGEPFDKKYLRDSMSDVVRFQATYDVPIWVGEFSAVRWAPGAEQYLTDLVTLFKGERWGWCYFNIGGMHAWNPDYGRDFAESPEDVRITYVGERSTRWETVRKIFKLGADQ